MDAVSYINASPEDLRADPAGICRRNRFLVDASAPSIGSKIDPSVAADWAPPNIVSLPIGTTLKDYFTHSPLEVPGAGGSLEVPSGGISLFGSIYLLYVGHSEFEIDHMGKSFLAKWASPSRVGPPDLQVLWTLDDALLVGYENLRFINVSPVASESYLYLFGTGDLRRQSGVFLARLPLTKPAIETGEDLEYYAGDGQWSPARSSAVRLISDPYMAEVDVKYVPELSKWLMLYAIDPLPAGRDRPLEAASENSVYIRVADRPDGPWSPPATIINRMDPAYASVCADTVPNCAIASFYAPYIYPHLTNVAVHAATTTAELWFQLSTWNPYRTVFMRTVIELPNANTTRERGN